MPTPAPRSPWRRATSASAPRRAWSPSSARRAHASCSSSSARISSRSRASPTSAASSSTEAALPERIQILVADDEPNLRRVLVAQLRRDGYDAIPAEDGAEAIALLEEHHVDLVITDLKMPHVDGMALLQQVTQ